MVKMFLNQFATAVFGLALVLAVGKAEGNTLRNVTSVGAILFYLFLLYTMTWELGYRDKASVDAGRVKPNLWTGALISLCANIPNFLFAIGIMMASLFHLSAISAIGGACSFLALTLEGMYTGVLANPVGGAPLNSYWFVYFLLPLPAILVSGLSYYLGLRDVKFTSIFATGCPEYAKDQKKKKDDRDV